MRRAKRLTPFRRDVQQAWVYIGERNPSASDRWLVELDAAITLIREQPGVGHYRPDVPEDLRAYRVASHILLYRVTSKRIELARLIHGSRDFTQIFPRR